MATLLTRKITPWAARIQPNPEPDWLIDAVLDECRRVGNLRVAPLASRRKVNESPILYNYAKAETGFDIGNHNQLDIPCR
jgi:hypothetical protein